MYSKVKRLRRCGERISDREISADPGTVGHMTICQVETAIVAKLHGAGDDALTVSMHGARMLFVGFERQGDQFDPKAATVMQEWSVEVMVNQPAEMAQTLHRTPD